MATDFIMPRMPTASRDAFYQQPQSQQFAAFQQYAANGGATTVSALNYSQTAAGSNFASQYNPQISPLSTSNNGSPNSPKANNYHSNRSRPLYIPAVLRPTEHPSRELPTKNAADSGSAVGDESEDGDNLDDEDAASRRSGGVRSSGSFISLPGLGAFGIGRLSRRSTNDSGKCITDSASWNLDLFPEVNGLPSRDHWKPDFESSMCDEPTCKRSFNYFTRRHHCRRCGNIFCDFHSAYEIPLDEQANYNPRGSTNRACAYCFREFRAWRSRTNSSDLSSTSSSSTAPGAKSASSASNNDKGTKAGGGGNILKKSATAPTSPVMALTGRTGRPGAPGTPTMAKAPDVAQSVPGDWNWSTF